jgi:hypothetical protein
MRRERIGCKSVPSQVACIDMSHVSRHKDCVSPVDGMTVVVGVEVVLVVMEC